MNKGKTIIWILSIILTFIIAFGVAYAYLAIRINNNETTSTVAFDTGTMEINYENNSGNIVLNKIIPGASVTKKFTLTGTNNTKINDNNTDNNMYYKIGIVVDNNTFSEDALRYSLTKDNESTNNGEQANNLNGSISQSGTRYIASGYFAGGASNAKHIYNLKISFPETGKDQSENQGATFACHIIIEQDRKLYDYSKTGVEFITNLYSSEERDIEGLLMDDTVDENIRYSGSNPKNYVEFGNTGELWRIIGIFNNITTLDEQGNEKQESLVKIIREESLGKYSWDSSSSDINDGHGINEWSQADLMTELNTDYINTSKTSGATSWYSKSNNSKTENNYDYSNNIKSAFIDKIAKVRWNLGGYSQFSISALNMYNAERGTLHISDPSDGVTRTSYWDGKIALMYPSDYGYASTDEECRNDLRAGQVYSDGTYDYTNIKCKNNNWLYKNASYWTLSPYSGDTYKVLHVYGGGIVSQIYAYYSRNVFTTLFLKSDTHFISGTGTLSDPYKLN